MSAGFSYYIEKLKTLTPLIAPRIEDSISPRHVAAAESEKGKTDTTLQADIPPPVVEKPVRPVKNQIPVASAKRKPKAPTPATYPFTIHVSSFKNSQTAHRIALGLKKKGHPAFTAPVQIPERGVWFRILIGHFETRKEALVGAMELKRRKFRYTFAMRLPFALQIEPFDSKPEPAPLNAAFGSRGYLPYTTRNGPGNEPPRMLIGAFKTDKLAHGFAQKLYTEGVKIKVVRR